MNRILGLFAGAALSLSLALPAAAEPANLLGVFGNWSTYTTGTGSSLTCYALSKPRASRPAGTKRASVYLMISDWPSRKVKAEPQIVYGYQGKENGVAALGVGADKFPFFIRNNGKDGSAWLQQLNDNNRLIDAMHIDPVPQLVHPHSHGFLRHAGRDQGDLQRIPVQPDEGDALFHHILQAAWILASASLKPERL